MITYTKQLKTWKIKYETTKKKPCQNRKRNGIGRTLGAHGARRTTEKIKQETETTTICDDDNETKRKE
jgi:hypothetical protein